MSLKTIPSIISATKTAGSEQQIPRILFQTFKVSQVPAAMWNASMSWIRANPDYEYRFFHDEACRSFIEGEFGTRAVAAFDRLPPGAFRADFWRYCVLYRHGGVYADIDTVCKRPLAKLISEHDQFIAPQGAQPHFIFTAFICAIPNHRFLAEVIERAITLIEKRDPRGLFHIVSSGALGEAVNTVAGLHATAKQRVGRHEINGYRYRILRKLVGPKKFRDVFFTGRVMDSLSTVFLCHYAGYKQDLTSIGVKHWKSQSDPSHE